MAFTYEERLDVELLKPDGSRLVCGSARVRVSGERLEVLRDQGGPLLVEFEAMASLRPEADGVRVTLDSGHDLWLRGAAESQALARSLSEARSDALVPALSFPDRPALAVARADAEWLDEEGVTLSEHASLSVLATHLVVVPCWQPPFALPLVRSAGVECEGETLGLVGRDGRVGLRARVGAGAGRFAEALQNAHSCMADALREWLGEGGVEAATKCGALGRAVRLADAEGASVRDVASQALAAAPNALSFLEALAGDRDARVGLALAGAETLRPLVWCLAPWRATREGATGVVVLVAARGATETAVFRGPAAGTDEKSALARLCRHVDAAVCALGLDLGPLRMRESDLPRYSGGGWLWPVRHFRSLRVARRACLGLVPYTSGDDWSQGVLAELSELARGAGRAT